MSLRAFSPPPLPVPSPRRGGRRKEEGVEAGRAEIRGGIPNYFERVKTGFTPVRAGVSVPRSGSSADSPGFPAFCPRFRFLPANSTRSECRP